VTLRRRTFLGAALSLAVAGCALLVGIHDETGVVRKPDPCVKHVPPGPSDASSDGPGPLDPSAELVFAMRTVIGAPPDGGTFGYDLDGRCTGNPSSTTNTAPCALAGQAPVQDGDGGIDNEFGALLPAIIPQGIFGDYFGPTVTRQIAEGAFTVLVYLKDYDGNANDPSVRAAVVLSDWLGANDCDASAPAPPDPTADHVYTPNWDGCDVWLYAKDSKNVSSTGGGDDGKPLIFSVATTTNTSEFDRAYVTDHVLVVMLTSLVIPIAAGTVATLNDAIVTARIESVDGGLALRGGVITGRAPDTNMLTAVANVKIEGQPICDIDGAVDVLKAQGCPRRDLPASKALDGTDASCTALSFAFGFEAFPAVLGHNSVDELDAACPPQGVACP
jgi:hypothetical protein